MSLRYLSNSNGAAQKAADAAAALKLQQEANRTSEANAEIVRGLRILNGRFEEAFQTKLSDEDLTDG